MGCAVGVYFSCGLREKDGLKLKIWWQNKKKKRRDARWAEWAASNTAHLKASATLATTPGSQRQVGSPSEKPRSPPDSSERWQVERTRFPSCILLWLAVHHLPLRVRGRKNGVFLEVQVRCRFKPRLGNYFTCWNEPQVRHCCYLRKQEKKLMWFNKTRANYTVNTKCDLQPL